ncbi:hypothetical protein EV384_4668 [Micromonospora kangleipakensis]|uniref:Endonuclease/exonuclease/phosphatase domain-containing protein n=1 Tax=Micromonospora kangleipakensis TaxID=1077942 RepID=A0A4V2GDI9_9ACTN|nr:hypothetical protein EV384_4668 [Micromonospora kangleipakensis]
MTWNVESLFRPDDTDPSAAETYAAKLTYLAGLISGTGANVVALQEIGSGAAADDLRAASAIPGRRSCPPTRTVVGSVLLSSPGTPSPRRRRSSRCRRPACRRSPDVDGGTLTHLGRGAVQVHVDCGGPGLRLLTAHLKSKLLTYPGGRRYPRNEDERARGAGYALLRRTAEAVALRVHLNDVLAESSVNGQPGMPTILCGDLNDGPDAVTTVLLEGPADGDVHRPDKGDAVPTLGAACPQPAPTPASTRDMASSSTTSSPPATCSCAWSASTPSSTTSPPSACPPEAARLPSCRTTPRSSLASAGRRATAGGRPRGVDGRPQPG